MKKILMLWFAATFLFVLSHAQDQLENPGFEEWDDILIGTSDTIREPASWSSLKTCDVDALITFAPNVCKRSTDAHSGTYSVKLTNVMTLLVANGTATNGRVHADLNTQLAYMYTDTINGQWNTPFTSKPDSIIGWFKYTPQLVDTMEVKVVLHRGFGKQPDNDYLNNWIGLAHFRTSVNTGNQWIRFSVPFIYFSDKTPQYVLIILNSGNGYSPAPGSFALFDDIEMIYNSTAFMENSATSSDYIYVVNNQYIIIQGVQPERYTSARVMDITGRIVWSGPVTSGRIDIAQSDLKKGIYLVSLTGKGIILTQKIVVR